MGANYDVLLLEDATREAVVGRLSEFLKSRRRCVRSIRTYAEFDERASPSSSAFIGHQGAHGWMLLVVCPSAVGVPREEWYMVNDFHRTISLAGTQMCFLWSHDSGFAAGYSLFERSEIREADYAIWDRRRDLPREPRAAKMPGELFAAVFGLPGEGYESFMDLAAIWRSVRRSWSTAYSRPPTFSMS